jgi:hypothetical protein
MAVALEDMDIPTRPTKFGAKFDPQPWNVKQPSISVALADMKQKKTTPRKISCWVLRKAIKGVSVSQNADRDFTGIVQAGVVEERIVGRYRKRLLDDSDSAMWLRQQVAETAAKAQKSKKKYTFVDGISANEEFEEEPDVELRTIVEATQMERDYREEKKRVAALLNRVRDDAVSHATPWMKQPTKKMVEKLNEMEKVSTL